MRCVDLFAGCGGMSLGFQNAGFDIVAAYDRWPAAVKIYRENFDHPIYEADLYQKDALEQIKSYEPEIIIEDLLARISQLLVPEIEERGPTLLFASQISWRVCILNGSLWRTSITSNEWMFCLKHWIF